MSGVPAETRTVIAARRALLVVHQVERTARRTGAWAAVAASILAALLVDAAWGGPAWLATSAVLLGAVLLLPAAILVVFAAGLGQLRRVPDGVIEDATAFFASLSAGATAQGGGAMRRLWSFVRGLLGSRAAVLGARERVLTAGLFLRVLHPVSLLAVLAALVATSVLVPVAAVAALLVLL